MKATGIVRRIDDLGRVVIPKEIRRTLRIREGDPLEIFTEKDGEVIFKKYSPMGSLMEFAEQMCEAILKHTGRSALICDRDTVIAASGRPRKTLMDKSVSQGLHQLLDGRKAVAVPRDHPTVVPTNDSDYAVGLAAPIVVQGDLLGGVVLLDDGTEAPGTGDMLLLQTIASFLASQMDN